jgi:hypothetical protein
MPGAPVPQSMSPEYARAGDEVTITGKNFYGSTSEVKVFFPGNAEAEVVSVTPTQIVAIVPAAAASTKGQLSVQTEYGSSRSIFTYRDDRGLFIDAEDGGASWNNWSLSGFDSDNGCSGTYIKFVGTTGSWAWPANPIQLYYINPTQQPIVTTDNVTKYALRFEAKSTEWHDTPLLMWFDTDNGHDVDAAWPQFHWKPYLVNDAKTNFSTGGKWITVTVPLADFNTDKEEKAERKINASDELVNFNMMWFGNADGDYSLDLRIDNLRIVPIE